MVYILTFFIVLLLVVILLLFFQNSKIKQQHFQNIQRLETMISSLHQKQLYLNDKVTISNNHDSNYRLKIKNISEEIVELQNVFVDIIYNKNIN